MQQQKTLPELRARHQEWKEKTKRGLEVALQGLSPFSEKEAELIATVRRTMYTLIYEEQSELKNLDPFCPYLSIVDGEGNRNIAYISELMKSCQMVQHTRPIAKDREEVRGCFKDLLHTKEKTLDDTTEEVVALFCEALLNKLFSRETKLRYHHLLLSSFVEQEDDAFLQSYIATYVANDRWEQFLLREKELFRVLFDFEYDALDERQKAIYASARKLFLGLINEEQKLHGMPFVSIYTQKGECNTNYWIEALDAASRKQRERPFADRRSLATYSDFDVIEVNSAPPKTDVDGITDITGTREGAVVRIFCEAVLHTLQELAKPLEHTRKNFEEELTYFQNSYCQALVAINSMRGFTEEYAKKLKIPYAPADTQTTFSPRKSVAHPFLQKCQLFEEEVATIPGAKKLSRATVVDEDAYFQQFYVYRARLKGAIDALATFQGTCALFAKSLYPPQEAKRSISALALSLHKPVKSTSSMPLLAEEQQEQAATPSPRIHEINPVKLEEQMPLLQAAQKALQLAYDLMEQDVVATKLDEVAL